MKTFLTIYSMKYRPCLNCRPWIPSLAPQKNKRKLTTTKNPKPSTQPGTDQTKTSVLHDKMRALVAELNRILNFIILNPDVKLVLMFSQFTSFKMGQTFTAEYTSRHLPKTMNNQV